MPIKPENKSRYPKNWKQIRDKILVRAENKCEFCKAPNHHVISRGQGDDEGTYMNEDAEVYCDKTGDYIGRKRMDEFHSKKFVTIVLTIAHLDHKPENCDDNNLKALCQKCHLNYDKEHHKINAQITRRKRKMTIDMFE